jgi:uncharacterized protein YdiU (UPF0061 family)
MNAIPFDNSYARLPDRFFTRLDPTPVQVPGEIRVNRELASYLGVNAQWLASGEGISAVAGNTIPEGAEPIATVYAGHQFGSYNPQLGDGRAILLGEVVAEDHRRYDIQLKGSGRTPYSRGGDGRSPLGPVLREYVVSEAMNALGVPTTRALAAVTTGEQVVRDTFLPGAVLARVASSHIRIGTFQYFAAHGDEEALSLLLDQVIQRHYPDTAGADNPALAAFGEVIRRQAKLVARWQLLGFIHGVMNTDNMLLCGETIDYGPCAFMDDFHPDRVFSSIDQGGRYAYRNQPGIAHWNLAGLARALLPLLHEDEEKAVELAQEAVDSFPELFTQAHREGMAAKLGLTEASDSDMALADDFLTLLTKHQLDFTLAFRRLADLADPEGDAAKVGDLFEFPEPCDAWLDRWRARLEHDARTGAQRQARMYAASPAFIPRNHLVEEAIRAAEDEGNLQPFHQLVERVTRPHEYAPESERYAIPPRPEQVVSKTFCGT